MGFTEGLGVTREFQFRGDSAVYEYILEFPPKQKKCILKGCFHAWIPLAIRRELE